MEAKSENQEYSQEKLAEVFQGFQGTQSELIPVLQEIQDTFGYIPKGTMREAARFLKISESSVYGVVTFYTQFYLTRQGRHKIKLCQGTACHVRGAEELAEAVQKKIGLKPGETSEDGEFSIERVACIGSCALAPAAIGDDKVHGPMTPEKMEELIDHIRSGKGGCGCK